MGVEDESVPGRLPICPNSFAEWDFPGGDLAKSAKKRQKAPRVVSRISRRWRACRPIWAPAENRERGQILVS